MQTDHKPNGDEISQHHQQDKPVATATFSSISTTTIPQHRSTQAGAGLLLALLLLISLVTVGSLIGQSLLAGTTPSGLTTSTGHNDFLHPSLNSQQINELRQLTRHMQYKQLASLYVARMSLDEELGQLIMVEYDDTSYSPDLDKMIREQHAGGVIMYEFQMETFEQTKHDIAAMQSHANIPLLISADEEGGAVHRLIHVYPPRLSAEQIYQTGDPQVATKEGERVAREMLALGINVNFAPDIDVAIVQGPDQVTRTFGSTVEAVITFAGAYMQAMQKAGVIACVKHYPGLGAATIDAHFGLPVINRTREEIYATELAPFKHFIQSQNKLDNPGMIMPTDVLLPAIDPKMPAELSHIFMTDILRKELKYDGVAVTDALYMKGISDTWSMPQAAVLALNAGDDMLLGPTGAAQTQEMLDGLKAALNNGTLSKARVDEAATRIITLKMERGIMPAVPPQF